LANSQQPTAYSLQPTVISRYEINLRFIYFFKRALPAKLFLTLQTYMKKEFKKDKDGIRK